MRIRWMWTALLILLAACANPAASGPPAVETQPPAASTPSPSPTSVPDPSPTPASAAAESAPPKCADAYLFYHPERRQMLLTNCFEDTRAPQPVRIWGWTEQGWELVDAQGPEGRVVGGAAFDSRRGRLVLYGGQPLGSQQCSRDTWEWDGSAWTQVDATGPAACDHLKLIYDGTLGKVLLFGGQDEQQQMLAETWTWDGQTWQPLEVAGPGARAHFGFAYDPTHSQGLLYGGFTGSVLSDFWVWRDGEWIDTGLTAPGARSHAGFAYDEGANALLLFGGATGASTFSSLTDETWILTGGSWRQLDVAAPSPRGSPAVAYDPEQRRILLFGGFAPDHASLDDTWAWDGQAWNCLANCE